MFKVQLSKLLVAASLVVIGLPCMAGPTDISGPTEVGTTIMPAGSYTLRDEKSKKVYTLTVTTKGTMIVAPATASIEAIPTVQAATTAIAPVAGAAGIAPVGAAGMPGAAGGKNDALNKLMQKGMQRGVKELMKHGGTKQIQNLIK